MSRERMTVGELKAYAAAAQGVEDAIIKWGKQQSSGEHLLRDFYSPAVHNGMLEVCDIAHNAAREATRLAETRKPVCPTCGRE